MSFGAEMHRTTSGPPPGIVHPQEKARLRQEELQRMEQQRAEEARLAAEAARREHAEAERIRTERAAAEAKAAAAAVAARLDAEKKQRDEAAAAEAARQREREREREAAEAEAARQKEKEEREREERKERVAAQRQAAREKAAAEKAAAAKRAAAAEKARLRAALQRAEAAKAKATAAAAAKAAEAARAAAAAKAAAAARAADEENLKKRKVSPGPEAASPLAPAAAAVLEEGWTMTSTPDIELAEARLALLSLFAQMPDPCACAQIVNVTVKSEDGVFKQMIQEVGESTFVAVDCEFSGIGNNKNGIKNRNMQMRYAALRSAIKSHGLLQLGLSIWRRVDRETTGAKAFETARYKVATYCIPLLPSDVFSVTPDSLIFLANAGIDLSRLCQEGVRFVKPSRARAAESGAADVGTKLLRELMAACCKKIFVTHNGLMDLMFLYEAFTAPLPETYNKFVRAIEGLYQGGLLDTKAVAEYAQKPAWSPSYLELLYHRSRRLCNTAVVEKGEDQKPRPHLRFAVKVKKAAPPKTAAESGGEGPAKRARTEGGDAAAASSLLEEAAAGAERAAVCPSYAVTAHARGSLFPLHTLHTSTRAPLSAFP